SPSGRTTMLCSASTTTTRAAQAPGRSKPGWRCCGHTCGAPSRHCAQRPQARMNGAVTRSPTAKPATSSPTSATTPANSWPGMCGSCTESSCPCQACQSLRHTPVACTAITAPRGGHEGSGTSTIAGADPKASKRTARIAGSIAGSSDQSADGLLVGGVHRVAGEAERVVQPGRAGEGLGVDLELGARVPGLRGGGEGAGDDGAGESPAAGLGAGAHQGDVQHARL